MKIARVCIQAIPGWALGDIVAVFPADPLPGKLLESIFQDVEVGDDFDQEIMVAVIEDGVITFEVSADKVTAKIIAAKTAEILALYNQMNVDVLTRMALVFGTTRTDSAAAYYETWKLMAVKPELFSSKGFTVDLNIEDAPYMTGDPLDTDLKVVTWAEFRILTAEAYSVYRMEKIEGFRLARAAILA